MGVYTLRALEGRRPDRRRLRLLAGIGAVRPLPGQGSSPGHGGDRPLLGDQLKFLGAHRRRPCHAPAVGPAADLIDMEMVQFHPTGMVWPPSVRGTLITEGVCAGEGGVLKNNRGERFMFSTMSPRCTGANSPTRRRSPTAGVAGASYPAAAQRRRVRPPRVAHARRHRPCHSARDQPRAVARRTAACFLDIASPQPRRSGPQATRHVSTVQRAGGRGHHQRPDGGRSHLPLHDGRCARRLRDAGVDRPGTIPPPAR